MELFHKKFKCEKCGQKFKTREELDAHMKTHMQEQPSGAPQQPAQPGQAQQPQQDQNKPQ